MSYPVPDQPQDQPGGDLILANDSQRLLLARNTGEGQGPSAILDGRCMRLGAKVNF